MSEQPPVKDLIVIVPDGEMETTVEALLHRSQSLGIRPVSSKILRHLQRDSGCRSDCHNYLRPWLHSFRYAMVLFDHEGCGREKLGRAELEGEVEAMLSANGWGNRCAVVTIAPELEAWVWSDSSVVDEVLGWRGRTPRLRDWVRTETGFWSSDRVKPDQPKEAFEAALREVRKQRSPTLYKDLAERVSVSRCDDPSFLKFKNVLGVWFPQHKEYQKCFSTICEVLVPFHFESSTSRAYPRKKAQRHAGQCRQRCALDRQGLRPHQQVMAGVR